MKVQAQILVVLLLLGTVASEGTITMTYADCQGTYQSANTPPRTLVEKKVDVRYNYALATGGWNQFPDMFVEINLDFSQFVYIKYIIATHTAPGCSWFFTRVNIDGNEDLQFRFFSGQSHHQHSAAEQVWMEKGRHTVQVNYYNNGGVFVVEPMKWGWPTGIFLIRYYQS